MPLFRNIQKRNTLPTATDSRTLHAPAGIRNFMDFWYQHPCSAGWPHAARARARTASSSSSSSQLPLKFLCEWEKAATHWDYSFEKDNRKPTNCERELRGHCKGIIKFNHSTSAAHGAAAAASGARVDAAVAGQDSEHLVKDIDVRWLEAFDIQIALEFQRRTLVPVVWRGRVEAPEFLRVLVRT